MQEVMINKIFAGDIFQIWDFGKGTCVVKEGCKTDLKWVNDVTANLNKGRIIIKVVK